MDVLDRMEPITSLLFGYEVSVTAVVEVDVSFEEIVFDHGPSAVRDFIALGHAQEGRLQAFYSCELFDSAIQVAVDRAQ